MDNLNIIAAIGKNNELGIDNHLIWHLKEDMNFFKSVTLGKTIIMGRKCFESLHGILPNRKHIVLTNNREYDKDGIIVYNDILDVLNYIKTCGESCFIIGGAQIYKQFLPYALNLYLTEIDDVAPADTYFPTFNKDNYDKELLMAGEENSIKYKMCLYKRR